MSDDKKHLPHPAPHEPPLAKKTAEHKHPKCTRKSLPDSNNQVTVVERKRLYHFACPACQQEDATRKDLPSQLNDSIKRTLFLVPDNGYDRALMVEYLNRKYDGGGQALGVRDHIPLGPLAAWVTSGVQVVVLSRRPLPGQRKAPNNERICREDGIWVDVDIPAERNLHEVVESRPIRIADCIQVESDLEMLYTPELQTDELLEVLCEVSYPYTCQRQDADKRITLTLGS